jgi:hypothetical protein
MIKGSYEQYKWEAAVKSYKHLVNFVKVGTTTALINAAKKRIAEYDQQYPQLKKV